MVKKQKDRKDIDSREMFDKQVSRRAIRKLSARKEKNHSTWFGLGMFGLVGWSVAAPTLIGIALGHWLDQNWPGQASWTLNCLIIGVVLGCLNAWYWVKQESRRN
jgi:ATP synthase protein I